MEYCKTAITSIAINRQTPDRLEYSTNIPSVSHVGTTNIEDTLSDFNKSFNGQIYVNKHLQKGDFIKQIELYPVDGTIQGLLVNRTNHNSVLMFFTTEGYYVDSSILLDNCIEMSWNTHAEGSHLLGCLLKNTVHVFDIEKGAVLHNFVCNNGLDIIWSGSNKNVIYSITCEGYLLRKDIREPDTGQFGEDYQQSLASKNSQIEISNNFIFVGNQEGHYNIFDLRTKNRIQHFTLQTDNFKNAVSEKDNKKGKLETLETLVNIPLFAVEAENSGNKFNFCSKYSVDFLMKKLDLSQEEDKSTVNFIQTRHVDNILDFKFHPTLPILYSSGLGLDVTNCKEPITYI